LTYFQKKFSPLKYAIKSWHVSHRTLHMLLHYLAKLELPSIGIIFPLLLLLFIIVAKQQEKQTTVHVRYTVQNYSIKSDGMRTYKPTTVCHKTYQQCVST